MQRNFITCFFNYVILFFLSFFFQIIISNNLFGQNVERLKSKITTEQSVEQVNIRVDLARALMYKSPDEAYKYAEQALVIANKLNYELGKADAYTYLGNLEALNKGLPEKAQEHHEKAYLIYRKMYEGQIIDKWRIYEFLNESAIPSYKYVVDINSKKKTYRKAIQKYEKLNGEFTQYLTAIAQESKNEILAKETKINENAVKLTEKEKNLTEKEEKLKTTSIKLKEKEGTERKLIIDKALLTGTLQKKEIESLALSDSLLRQEVLVKDQALTLDRQKHEVENAEKEKLIQEAEKKQAQAEVSKQRIVTISLFIGLGVMAIAIFFVFTGLQKQKKLNGLLNKKNEEIEIKKQEIELQHHELQQATEEIEAQRDYLAALNDEIKTERDKADHLLNNILPIPVANQLKEKGVVKPQYYEQATVIFTDFKGFTNIVEKLTPTEVIEELGKCFLAFDEICEKYNLEKIKTMGDGYMCAGGIPETNHTNPLDAVKAGLAMVEFMQKLKEEKLQRGEQIWEVRVGIHTGALIAGVIGKNKFAYDIWGDTVNLASRMESSGEAGRVNISGDTYELVKDVYNCTYRGKIQAKNKGEVDMYFVEVSPPAHEGANSL